MKISELTTGQGNVDVEGNLSEVGEPKVFTKFGRELKVSNAILKDDSGSIKLTLWNEDVSKFNEGDTVRITNGYVNEFQGEPQLTAGKFGKMEKVGEGEVSESSEEEGQASLSDETAETMAEDASEDAAVEGAVKEEAPEGTSEEQVEEASEELEEASEEAEEEKEKSEESEEKPKEPEEKHEESQEDF